MKKCKQRVILQILGIVTPRSDGDGGTWDGLVFCVFIQASLI